MLRTVDQTSILNRTCRALANLAEDELSVLVMEELGIIPELVKLLTKTSDNDCQESVLRALRMVCTTPERKQAVLDLDAVKVIVDLLKSEKSALVSCCIRTVAELTKGCSREIAQQIQDHGGVKYIVELANSTCAQVRHSALLSLTNLACHAHVRVCIGSEGGIQALTQQLKHKEPGHVTIKSIEGLCFCCREAINRARVHESGALELLVKMLSSGKCLSLERKIVTAFSYFCYSEPALEILLNADLVPALIGHLNRVLSHLPSRSEVEDHDEDFSDQLCFSSDISSDSQRSTTTKDTFFDTSGEALMDESFLKKLEETAREVHVSDSKASGRLSNFKRRMKLKPSPIPTTPPPGVCTMGSGQSVFSFASRHTNTTSLVAVYTSPRSISSLTSFSGSERLLTCSTTQLLSSCQVSTPLNTACSSAGFAGQTTKGDDNGFSEMNSGTFKSKFVMFPSTCTSTSTINSDQAKIAPVKSKITNERLPSPSSPRTQSSLHHRSPGHSALVLLSRISHMTDPSSLLVNTPCIQTLLGYLCAVDNPSPKCKRLLTCLADNLLCFRALIVHGSVVAIHHQLCCMCSENQETVATVTKSITKEQDAQSASFHSGETNSFATPSTDSRHQHNVHDQESKANSTNADGTFNFTSSVTHSYCQETGKHLLEIFSNQAQTPFGRGVLENLLLKGSKEDLEECVLALPLLCR